MVKIKWKHILGCVLWMTALLWSTPTTAADALGQFYAYIDGQKFFFKGNIKTHQAVLAYDPNLTYTGEIIIPETIKDPDTGVEYDIYFLEQFAFKNQTGITRLEFSDKLEDLGHNVFEGCTGLKAIIFGRNLKHLWKYTFVHDTNLETMAFGKSDKYFEAHTFDGVDHEHDVYCYDPVPKDVTGEEPFAVVGQTATLWVPVGTREEYKKKLGWRQFQTIKEFVLLDENAPLELTTAAPGVRVVFKRTIKGGVWNSYCAPLTLTPQEITDVFGDGTQVLEFDPATTEKTLKFKTATTIEANKPYMVKPTKAWTTYVFDTHDVALPAAATVQGGGYNFTGVFNTGYVPLNAYFLSGNTYYKSVVSNGNRLRGYRTYLTANQTPSPAKLMFYMAQPTGIGSLVQQPAQTENVIYHINGQRAAVGSGSIDRLPAGIYIINGKKTIKR